MLQASQEVCGLEERQLHVVVPRKVQELCPSARARDALDVHLLDPHWVIAVICAKYNTFTSEEDLEPDAGNRV